MILFQTFLITKKVEKRTLYTLLPKPRKLTNPYKPESDCYIRQYIIKQQGSNNGVLTS